MWPEEMLILMDPIYNYKHGVCIYMSVFYFSFHLFHTFWGRLEQLELQCLSVRPGLEIHIPKKTHNFSFQVSRNEGSVCLGT